MKLSVVIPVYNEARTVAELVSRVASSPVEKELVIVDDGSSDGTGAALDALSGPGVRVIHHPVNRGKGMSIRTALEQVSGDLVIVQDADLEYDPADYPALIQPILDGRAQVVYGTRFHPGNQMGYSRFKIAARMLTWLVNLLFGARITDEATCYKVFKTEVIKAIPLRCERFEFCPEITAKVLKRGIAIVEVPIRYAARTEAEGKKIRFRDGVEAFWTLLKYRFVD
ncbi:MAG: glycosyltransferase family 2 protein [Candidatus Riflebacteria bacterium]|nr:glycosyltransferase family 2 protein [Candidatus Riflebacteria bacterium]